MRAGKGVGVGGKEQLRIVSGDPRCSMGRSCGGGNSCTRRAPQSGKPDGRGGRWPARCLHDASPEGRTVVLQGASIGGPWVKAPRLPCGISRGHSRVCAHPRSSPETRRRPHPAGGGGRGGCSSRRGRVSTQLGGRAFRPGTPVLTPTPQDMTTANRKSIHRASGRARPSTSRRALAVRPEPCPALPRAETCGEGRPSGHLQRAFR